MVDWSTIASLATAGGTLVLAVATFASVRSGSRSARVAERALLVGLRPLLMPTRYHDQPEKIGFVDRWVIAPGGRGVAEVTDAAIYLAIPVRNAGSGIAVLHGWMLYPELRRGADAGHEAPGAFRRLTRDLYVAAGDTGFWQGALRDPSEPVFAATREAVIAREGVTVDLLYGDHEGGQRTISRFALVPHGDTEWLVSAARHWNLDRPDPR